MTLGNVSHIAADIAAAIGSEHAPDAAALEACIARVAQWMTSPLQGVNGAWRSPLGGYWTTTVAVVDGDAAVTPLDADLRLGVWTLPSTAVAPAAVGWWISFDAAMVEALDVAIAAAAAQFDYAAEDADFKRSQPARALLLLREQYAQRAAQRQPVTLSFMRRGDMTS